MLGKVGKTKCTGFFVLLGKIEILAALILAVKYRAYCTLDDGDTYNLNDVVEASARKTQARFQTRFQTLQVSF